MSCKCHYNHSADGRNPAPVKIPKYPSIYRALYIYIYLNWCRVSEPSTIWIPINHYGMSQPTNRTGASSDWQGQLSRSDNVASCGADWSHVDVHPAATGQFVDFLNMGVSENRGTPKSSILIGFSSINHPFWGTPILETFI